MVTKEKTKTGAIKVMIVEDYKLTRVGLRCALNDYEHLNVCYEADSAENCLEMLKVAKPDVVLMDLGLPGVNGLEATIKIRANYPDMKVVMLTSHNREEEVLAALGAGATGYCLKDVPPETLAEVIKTVHNGACFIDSNVARCVLKSFPKPKNTDLSDFSLAEGIKSQLTDREREVLKLLVEGRSNTEIAQALFVSVHTAKAHVCNILQKLCVDDRVQAAVKAIREELI